MNEVYFGLRLSSRGAAEFSRAPCALRACCTTANSIGASGVSGGYWCQKKCAGGTGAYGH